MPHLTELAGAIREINQANGWNLVVNDDWERDKYKIPAVLALIHSEASEALEAYRKNDRENFAEEMADVIIRVLDCVGGLDIDMDAEIDKKLARNRLRGYRHGNKTV
jgi:NTP pyrophosphatase (non-canonical NTP hydrolase)